MDPDGVALGNCIPVSIASDSDFAKRFADRGIPIVGDDIKAPLGATITHRTLTDLFRKRGVQLDCTNQLDTGGNTDFLSMPDRDRLASEKESKTQAVQFAALPYTPRDMGAGNQTTPVGPCLGLCSILALVFGASTSTAQSISVDAVPAYGTLGFITGTVGGVEPSAHRVAVYIQIEGSGWWTKPTFENPTVAIDPAGNFSANVGTGGPGSLDSRATIFCAALLPDTTAPPLVSGGVRIPASLAALTIDCRERYGRTLEFAGYTWAVKEAPLPVGPGPNVFSNRMEDVFVDPEGLHLRVAFHDGQWWSTEVLLLTHFGYGTYVVQTDSELDALDVHATFGIFTWDSYGDEETVPGAAHREIDFEDSRWGNASDPTNAQMVVQPFSAPDNLRRYTLPDLSVDSALTRFFVWQSDSIEFVALSGHHPATAFPAADVIDEYLYLHDPPSRHVPTAGREYLRLNLWLNNAETGGGGLPQPAGGQTVEVVITDVVYLPEPGGILVWSAGLAALALLRRRQRARRAPDQP